MVEVCLLGEDDVSLQYELLSRETSRNALAAYTLREPFDNAIALDTVSLGSAVALLNDLDWYLIRFVDTALVRDPSISQREWLSRALATAIREDRVDPSDCGRFLKIYGLETDEPQADTGDEEHQTDDTDVADAGDSPPRLVEPMLVTRTGETIPEYDLREVGDTVIVRLTEAEFGA